MTRSRRAGRDPIGSQLDARAIDVLGVTLALAVTGLVAWLMPPFALAGPRAQAWLMAPSALIVYVSSGRLIAMIAGVKHPAAHAVEQLAPATEAEPCISAADGMDKRNESAQRLVAQLNGADTYIETLVGQISGAQGDVSTSVVAIIAQINAVHADSTVQLETISQSVDSSAALTKGLDRPAAVIAELRGELARRDQEISVNADRIVRLVDQLSALTPIVDTVRRIARRSETLAYNAAIEASRAGAQGGAFAVIAEEMRKLAQSTNAASADAVTMLTTSISAAQVELEASKPAAQRSSISLGRLVEKVESLQAEFRDNSSVLVGVIDSVSHGHQAIIRGLSDMLGLVQFDDVIRQRLDHVKDSMHEMGRHIKQSCQGVHGPMDAHTKAADFASLLEAQSAGYVMESQTTTHLAVVDRAAAQAPSMPAIQLF